MESFTFGIVTDTHIRDPSGDLSSPFPVNDKANGRARFAVELLAASKPDFVVHLGDVVHPLPHTQSFVPAVREAHRILQPLKPNLYFVPGNHDIGDKPLNVSPAAAISDAAISSFSAAFGKHCHLFRHKGAVFVCINASLVNSGLAAEHEQQSWLEATLAPLKGERIYLFSHYPPFISDPEEDEHYDNIAEPGRTWLLELAANAGVNTIFSGHVHHFFYNRYRGVRLFCLPATSFTRQDYAELFAVSPAGEHGRDDTGKLSVTLQRVDARSSPPVLIATGGAAGYAAENAVQARRQTEPLPLIPHLRHAWHAPKLLPYNGPMEEFSRKEARNDYPLLRLLQLGIETIRVPLSDLCVPRARRRIDDWAALGRKIAPFCIAAPTRGQLAELDTCAECVAALELLSSNDGQSDIVAALPQDFETCPVWLSGVNSSAFNHDSDAVYFHSVTSGFTPSVIENMDPRILNLPWVKGLVMRLGWEDCAPATLRRGLDAIQRSGLTLVVNICIASDNPARANFSSEAISERIDDCLAAARQHPELVLKIDTFEDVDRGYSPRFGLIDRLGNIRISPGSV